MSIQHTHDLADFALTGTPSVEAMHAGRRAVTNILALVVGASRGPVVTAAADVARRLSAPGSGLCTVVSTGDRVAPPWAALVHGIAAHVEDFDDTSLPSVLHPGAPTIPAALAAAELTRTSGRDFVEAVVMGMEVAIRIADSVTPVLRSRRWQVVGNIGPMGSAVAAGRLLGLDTCTMATALHVAGTQGSGLLAALGTDTKSVHAGRAAANGLESALLAQAGLVVRADPFSRSHLYSPPGHEPARLEEQLQDAGHTWRIEDNALKPYACGVVAHPAIDAAIAARDAGSCPHDVVRIEVDVHPSVLTAMGTKRPRTGLESKFSVFHAVAVGLLFGEAGPRQFTDAAATDEQTALLRDKVEANVVFELALDQSRLRLVTNDGRSREFVIAHATGSADNPMTDRQLRAKADSLVRTVADASGVEAFFEAMTTLDELDNVGVLTQRLADLL